MLHHKYKNLFELELTTVLIYAAAFVLLLLVSAWLLGG